MQTKKIIETAFPRGPAGLVVGYAIAPDDASSMVIGMVACIEQCANAPDAWDCAIGAARCDAAHAVWMLINEWGVSPSEALKGAAEGAMAN